MLSDEQEEQLVSHACEFGWAASQRDHACCVLHQTLPAACCKCLQETALSALRVAAQLCGELLQECHAAPPEALVNAAIQLHDHALLVREGGGGGLC